MRRPLPKPTPEARHEPPPPSPARGRDALRRAARPAAHHGLGPAGLARGQADHADRSLHRGRQRRRQRAPGRHAAGRAAQAGGGDRQRGRCRRRHRRGQGRGRGARRLHAGGRPRQRDRHRPAGQPLGLPLRSAQGPGAGRPAQHRADGAGGAPRPAREELRRLRAARQGRARQVQLRHLGRGHRAAARDGTAQAAQRHLRDPRALPRRPRWPRCATS